MSIRAPIRLNTIAIGGATKDRRLFETPESAPIRAIGYVIVCIQGSYGALPTWDTSGDSVISPV